jgi:hypothetical protein
MCVRTEAWKAERTQIPTFIQRILRNTRQFSVQTFLKWYCGLLFQLFVTKAQFSVNCTLSIKPEKWISKTAYSTWTWPSTDKVHSQITRHVNSSSQEVAKTPASRIFNSHFDQMNLCLKPDIINKTISKTFSTSHLKLFWFTRFIC